MRRVIFLTAQLIVLAQCLPEALFNYPRVMPPAAIFDPVHNPSPSAIAFPGKNPAPAAISNPVKIPAPAAVSTLAKNPRPMPVAPAAAQQTVNLPPKIQQTKDQLELVKLGDNQYYFSNVQTKVPWSEAQQFCSSHNMNLANVQSVEENTVLHEYVKKLYERRFWGFWLGASDTASEGDWAWDGLQEPMNYNNWDADQPSGGNKENCLILHRSDGAWNDFDCARNFSYICKKPSVSGDIASVQPAVSQVYQPAATNDKDFPTTVAFGGLEVVPIGNSQFYFSNRNNKVNWEGARNFCKTNKMELASIQSDQENQDVNAYAKKLYDRGLWGAWLGGNDAGQEGTWLWDGPQQPLSYNKFDADQPGGGPAENCLLMHRSDGRWNDFDCAREFVFICKVITR